MLISFKLNGKDVFLETAPDRKVIDLLREDLGLTGSKESCGRGDCGSCSILVDGEQRLSCLMLAAQLEGREIITIEGFSLQHDQLNNVQQKFIETWSDPVRFLHTWHGNSRYYPAARKPVSNTG